MVDKWLEMGQKNLEQGDTIERTYPAMYNRKSGYLLVAKKKLMFVSEEGLFGKKYNMMFDMPYQRIGNIAQTKNYVLEITETDGRKHDLTFEFNASNVQKVLEEFRPPVRA